MHLDKTFVSIIIPVFNNAVGLKGCLQALDDQTYPAGSYEVMVVDNSEIENSLIKEVVGSFPHGIYLREAHPGSYVARNKGLSIARGAVIAFTDADCIPAHDWVERGIRYFKGSDGYMMLAGRIDVYCKNRDCPTAPELHELVFAFPQKYYIEKLHFAATANMWTSRKALNRVGFFAEDLFSGGDRYWGEKAFADGIRQVFAHDVIVGHPARHSFRDLVRMYARIVEGDQDRRMLKKQSNVRVVIDLIFDCGILFRQTIRSWQTTRLKNFRERILVNWVAFFIWLVRVTQRLRVTFWRQTVRLRM